MDDRFTAELNRRMAHLQNDLDDAGLHWSPASQENVLRVQALAAELAPKEPFPARLEVGPVALERIKAVVPSREAKPWDWMSELVGLPVVVSHALEPDGWRLIDSNGDEMQAGRFS